MNYGFNPVQMNPQDPQNPFHNFYAQTNVPIGIGHTPSEITSADSLRAGKKIIDDAFMHASAFANREWIHIELPAPSPVPPAYPTDIDPLAGLSPGNAAAIGRKYFHGTITTIKNFVMPPPDPNQVVEPLEINPDEGLSARNTGIVGRRVVEDILSCIIESAMNTVALIYSAGRTIINIARRILGMPILEEPAAKGTNPEDVANDLNELNALDELDDLNDVEDEPEVEDADLEVDAEEEVDDVDPEDPIDDVGLDPIDAFDNGVDPVEDDQDTEPVQNDAAHDDLDPVLAPPRGHPAGFVAPAAAVMNPVHHITGGGVSVASAPQAQPRRVQHQPAHRPAARPPQQQPVAPPPPRIEDTDPFYTQIPHLTQSQADDLAFLMKALNGNAGSIAMNALSLRQRGANVDVHPFRFLSHVMVNQDLRDKFKSLRERPDIFGTQFVSEFDTKFSDYQNRGQLIPYHKGFAHAMHVNPKTVETLCNEKKWKLLILLLHETASGAKAPFVPKVPAVRTAVQPAPQPARSSHPARPAVNRVQAQTTNLAGAQQFQAPMRPPAATSSSSAAAATFFVDPAFMAPTLPAHTASSHLSDDDGPVDDVLAEDDVDGHEAHTPVDLDQLVDPEGDAGEEVHLDDGTVAADASDIEEAQESDDEDDGLDDLAALSAAKPLTPQQQATAARIFEQVATSDPITLGINILSIRNDWRQLHDTHPSMLLKEVFGNDTIVQNLRTIHLDFTKRDLFISDLSDACAKGEQKNVDTALEKTQEALTELGITRPLTTPIQWKDLIKELIILKCTITSSNALTPVQIQAIDEALTSIATTNEFMLLGHLISLRRKWATLEQACPLQTLRYIFTHKQDLTSQIISQSFKKGSFLSDVATTLKNSCKMRDISAHTADFAMEFGIQVDLLNNKEWSRVLNEIIAARIPQGAQSASSTPPPISRPAALALPLPPLPSANPSLAPSPAATPPPSPRPAVVVPPTVPVVLATSDPLSQTQKGTLDEIFSNIATKNELWLLGNLASLERKWASLEQACPLQILRYVFTDKKDLFHQINDQTIRRGPFLFDFSRTLSNCGKDRALSSFADAFALEFHVPRDMVTKKDWSAIIDSIKSRQIDETERASTASAASGSSAASSSSVFQNIGARFKSFGGMFGGKKDDSKK